jgi:hypothetical protein
MRMTVKQPTGPTGDGPLFGPRLVITAVALAGIVIFAFVAVVAHRGSGAPEATSARAATRAPRAVSAARRASSAPSPAPAASPAASPAGAGCHAPPGSQAIPAAAPPGVTWRLYDTIALPFSAQAGPAVITGDVACCYAHSPTGALLAAVQIAVRVVLAANWRTVLAAQVLPGTGRNVYAAERPGEAVTIQPGEYAQIAGFQFITYSSDVAVIQIVSQLPSSGQLQMTAMTVMWVNGDWRLELQPDGAPGPNVQQLSSLTGFIPWEGV